MEALAPESTGPAPMPQTPPPAAVIETLNDLLDAEQTSIFHALDAGSPYLGRAGHDLRRTIDKINQARGQRVIRLAGAIEALGGYPAAARLNREEQYLAYLSLKFLVPKLAEAERLMVRRYENALRTLKDAAAPVRAVVESLLAEHQAHVQALETTKA